MYFYIYTVYIIVLIVSNFDFQLLLPSNFFNLHIFICLIYFHFLSASLAKPKNSANIVTVQAGSKSVVVAQCEAADGKPAATIKWLASVGGNHSTTTTNGPDGTVTVRSEYRLVPTPADNGREVTCLVDQRTQDRPWDFPVKLSVECKMDIQCYYILCPVNYMP